MADRPLVVVERKVIMGVKVHLDITPVTTQCQGTVVVDMEILPVLELARSLPELYVVVTVIGKQVVTYPTLVVVAVLDMIIAAVVGIADILK